MGDGHSAYASRVYASGGDPQTAKQFGAVRPQLYRKDVDQVIIATDAGREGELVARWILDKTGCTKPIRRLWISSVTDKAIKEGFQPEGWT